MGGAQKAVLKAIADHTAASQSATEGTAHGRPGSVPVTPTPAPEEEKKG